MLQIGVEGALDEEGDQHLRSGRPFIIRIFFQNQIPDAAFQLSDQNASAAAGKKDFQKSGLTGKGAENFQRRLFLIIKKGFRLVAVDNGIVIAANWWGKLKTISQMIMIILLILNLDGFFNVLETAFVYIAVALTVISLVDYIWANRQVLNTEK